MSKLILSKNNFSISDFPTWDLEKRGWAIEALPSGPRSCSARSRGLPATQRALLLMEDYIIRVGHSAEAGTLRGSHQLDLT